MYVNSRIFQANSKSKFEASRRKGMILNNGIIVNAIGSLKRNNDNRVGARNFPTGG